MSRPARVPQQAEAATVAAKSPAPAAPRKRKPPVMKVQAEGLTITGNTIGDEPDKIDFNHLCEAIGIRSPILALHLVEHVVTASQPGQGKPADEHRANAMLHFVAGMEPRDGVETLLKTQMALLQKHIFKISDQLTRVDNLQQLEVNEKALNRMMRTFALQADTL